MQKNLHSGGTLLESTIPSNSIRSFFNYNKVPLSHRFIFPVIFYAAWPIIELKRIVSDFFGSIDETQIFMTASRRGNEKAEIPRTL